MDFSGGSRPRGKRRRAMVDTAALLRGARRAAHKRDENGARRLGAAGRQ